MPAVTRPNPGDPADGGATQDTTIVDQLADRDDYLDGAKEATGVAATLDAAHVAASDPHGDRAAAAADAATKADAAKARSTHTGTQPMSTISDAGNAATRNVGTTAGTVAAGDDARFGAGGGTTWLSGSAAPTGATGADGNYYLRDPGSAYHFELVYGPRAAGVWPTPILVPKGSGGTVVSFSGAFAAGTPIYMARQNIYLAASGGATAGDKSVVNTQYLTGPPAGNTRLASGPAGVSYKMGFWGAAGAPMLGFAAVSARQASLPSTGSQGVGFAMCDAGGYGFPAGVVATTNSLGALRIEGWSGASVLNTSANGLVVANDIIALVVNGGMLTASCFDGTTNALKGRVEALMPTGDDATYAQEVGMWWLNNGDGKQLLLRGAY